MKKQNPTTGGKKKPASGTGVKKRRATPDADGKKGPAPRTRVGRDAAAGPDRAESTPDGEGVPSEAEKAPRGPLPRGVKVLAGAAVGVLLAGAGFQGAAANLRAQDAVRNEALVDTTASTQVVGDVTAGLNAILSYSYTDTSSPRQAARRMLVGDAARQYGQLISVVRQQAPRQHIVLRSNVITAAPISLTEDHAELLVFLDQSTRRGRTGKTSNVAAQLLITAQHQSDRWVISNIAIR